MVSKSRSSSHHHHHQSLNREGRWGTTDNFATSFLHFPLFSAALWDLPNSRPVHSLMLSSHLFLCPPRLLPPFTVPCKMVSARPDERETWPYHCSLRLFTIVRRSSCGPIACWISARTSSLVKWSLYEMCSTHHPMNPGSYGAWGRQIETISCSAWSRWIEAYFNEDLMIYSRPSQPWRLYRGDKKLWKKKIIKSQVNASAHDTSHFLWTGQSFCLDMWKAFRSLPKLS